MTYTLRNRVRPLPWAGLSLLPAILLLLAGCSSGTRTLDNDRPALEVMSNMWQKNLQFEQEFFKSFSQRRDIPVEYVPNASLNLYQKLLQAHTRRPDLLEVDVVWPAMLADHLVDLRPYLRAGDEAFSPELLTSYTVNGRLVALPLFPDIGVLYYRKDLLAKYEFDHPPATWDELERMAYLIQRGERNRGKKNFWGYIWQGALSEGLTCNAVEWQASSGAGDFITRAGSVNVTNPQFEMALERAVGWLGRISPAAQYVYREDDSMNVWNAGQTAFMRNWASAYGQITDSAAALGMTIGVTAIPAGPAGHQGTLGGLGISISKYASNPDSAVKALLELTSRDEDRRRVMATRGIPTHASLLNQPDMVAANQLLAIAPRLMAGAALRPTDATGNKYAQASRDYAAAVNSVLRRQAQPHAAMIALNASLSALMATKAPH